MPPSHPPTTSAATIKAAILHLSAQIVAYETAIPTLDAQIAQLNAEISRADVVTAVLVSGNESMLAAMGGTAVRAKNRPGGGVAGERGKDDGRGGGVDGDGERKDRKVEEKGKGKEKGERVEKKVGSGEVRDRKSGGGDSALLKKEVTRIWTEILRLEAPAREDGDGAAAVGRVHRVAGPASGGLG